MPHNRFARALAVLLSVTAAASPLWAAPGDMTQVPAPVLGADPPEVRDIADGDAAVSTQTGDFSFAYPIALPPGLLNMKPDLALRYSSQAPTYGGIAMGWSLSIPEIALDTSDSLITHKLLRDRLKDGQFVSSLAGGRSLVPVSETALSDVKQTFRARNDGTFARYELMQDGVGYRWRVRTLDGNTHYFGEQSRASYATYSWSPLTRTVDPFGNTIEYLWNRYEISQIRYTSNPGAGLPAFARVDFVWQPAPQCDGRIVGLQADGRLGITRGENQLAKIRAVPSSRPTTWTSTRARSRSRTRRTPQRATAATLPCESSPGSRRAHGGSPRHASICPR